MGENQGKVAPGDKAVSIYSSVYLVININLLVLPRATIPPGPSFESSQRHRSIWCRLGDACLPLSVASCNARACNRGLFCPETPRFLQMHSRTQGASKPTAAKMQR